MRMFVLQYDLERDGLKKGDLVYEYTGCTYGCCASNEIACTKKPNETPFFGIPVYALANVQSTQN